MSVRHIRIPTCLWLATLACTLLITGCGGGGGGAGGGETVLQGSDGARADGWEAVSTPGCLVSEDCPLETPVCDQFTNTCVECKKDGDCDDPALPRCNPAKGLCVECMMANHCPTGYLYCLDGKCSEKPCVASSAFCVGNSVHICSADGMDPNYEVVECGGKKCTKGQCLECTPKEVGCKGKAVIQCDPDGKNYKVLETCSGNLDCFGGKCLVCYPGDKMCQGNTAMTCNVEGAAWEMKEDCAAADLTCYMGACLSPCAGDLKQNTNAGCEFFAVDLDNYESAENDAQHAQYAVIVSNTSKDQPADVTVTLPDGSTKQATVPAMSLQKFELPATWSINNTVKTKSAFRVTATRPIIVYQFNPLSNIVEVFSNDASVLLPAPSLGNEYYVLTWGFGGLSKVTEEAPASYFTVVGVSSIPTQVTFTVTDNTLAGDIPALTKGQSHTVELAQGEVLNVNTSDPSGDLTGTHITANAPIAVFGGHECPYTANRCCCDHLEEQLIPVSMWGDQYVMAKSWERWKEKDWVRILAAHPDTHVTLNPPVANVPVLGPGQYYTFQSNVSLQVTADKPVLVAQFLASSFEILGEPFNEPCNYDSDCPQTYTCDYFSGQCAGPECVSIGGCPSGHTCESYPEYGVSVCEAIGDPAMILLVPQQQFMESYVFLSPDAYLEDYVNVIAPLDAGKVVLDSMQIAPESFIAVGTSGYGVYRTQLNDGVHVVWSDKKIGIVVYGYDNDVSYGYPGGMGLVELN
jgi:hypothetical protein